MAAAGGVGIGDVLALEADEHAAYVEAVRKREQAAAWSQDTELLASAVDLLHALLIEIRRGVPMLQVKRQARAPRFKPVKRPAWLTSAQPSDVIVIHPRQLRDYLK